MPLPNLAVIVPTYNRPDIVRTCILRLQEHLHYSGSVTYLVGDDSEVPLSAPALEGLRNVLIFNGPRNGLGANLNLLLRAALSSNFNLYLQMDDDHWLMKPLDLDPHVQHLVDDPTAGCIRLMGISGHHYTAQLKQSYWKLLWDAPELYLASMRPHLKHRRFHDVYGLYPEGLKLGQTEETFCHQCREYAHLYGGPDVLVPLDVLTESSWTHVGDSWQTKGL